MSEQLVKRLLELSDAVTKGKRAIDRYLIEFAFQHGGINPLGLVLAKAARRIEYLEQEAFRIKPLVWEHRRLKSVEIWKANALGWKYEVVAADGAFAWEYVDEEGYDVEQPAESLEAAKQAAEAHWRERIVKCLEVVR